MVPMMFTAWRRFATKVIPVPYFDKEIITKLENETMHPRRHSGRNRCPIYQVPEKIFNAIKVVLSDYSSKILVNDGIVVTRYFRERLKPAERVEVEQKTRMLQERTEEKYQMNTKQIVNEKVLKKATKEVIESLLRHTYVWAPTDFSDYLCYPYLASRSAAEYAILRSIFREVSVRDPSFQPKSVFDFGSGVGTVIWATQSVWEDSIKEYYCVDSSGTMNDIAKQIIGGGKIDGKSIFKAQVYHRQFLPASRKHKYNVVVSAFSLLELPDAKSRLETISNLWDKTEDYLVIVELGSKGGFEVVNEARDYILGYFLNPRQRQAEGHVFAPCPHDVPCPKASRSEPCTFQRKYFRLPFDNKLHVAIEEYSYVVLKKGKRDPEDPQWPRIVQPVLVRTEHTRCRMCTADGKFQEIIFTKDRHTKLGYWCARMSDWGDRLPINDIKFEEPQKIYVKKKTQPNKDPGKSEAENSCAQQQGHSRTVSGLEENPQVVHAKSSSDSECNDKTS